MKGRSLILIFLFLFSLQTVCAESHTGEVDLQLSEDAPDWSLLDAHTYGLGITIEGFQYKGVADAGIPNTLVFRDASMGRQVAYAWSDIPQNVGGSFALYDNGVFAGTGGITVHRVNDVDAGRVDIWYMFDDTDFVINTSETTMDVTLYASPISEYYNQFHVDYWGNPYTTQNVYIQLKSGSYVGTHASWTAGGSSYVEYDYYGHFINEYNITLSGATASTVITRDGLGQQLSSSRLKLTNSTGSTVYLPSSYSTTNSTHNHDNGSYYYYLDVENYGDVLIYEGMGSAPPHTGDIEFNQTFYTDPEDIQVSWDVDSFDSGAYVYEVQVITSASGVFSQDSWPADGNWNVSPFISSASGAAVFDLYSEGYDLSIWIQGELWAQDKSSGAWTKLDSTPAVLYHEAVLESGKIWMDQAVYDTGDTATVSYETVSDSAYVIVRKYPKAVWSQGEYYIWNVPAGTGTRTFVIPPSGTGDWKAELSESDITVNETMFLVNETTISFLAWDDIDGIIGESQILHFYSNDVNATLQIYDGDQIVIYDETVGDGYFHDYVISTHTNQAPGTWIASLNCSGSYYNDTLLMYAKDAYVSFNADSYTLGQTISIQYYLKRSTQSIVLYDSNNQDIITWTTAGNYIHHGIGTGSVDFTLSDDNEYGLDIVAGVDANNIKLGLWKVEVLDRGQPIADNPVYDSAKVSESIDDPADTSNEMISIFFSPEGVFLLFTVCLTMMGLVLSHHPAGGGAGAVVGVGFGVYFGVLPPWMLFLMVIALVVLAGVSVAIYFKGK